MHEQDGTSDRFYCDVCGPIDDYDIEERDVSSFIQGLILHHPGVQPFIDDVAVCPECGNVCGFGDRTLDRLESAQKEANESVAKDLAQLVRNSLTEKKRLVPVPVTKLAGLVHWVFMSLGQTEEALQLDEALRTARAENEQS